MFRHRLIEEAKAELDSVFQEVKREEYALMASLRERRDSMAAANGGDLEKASRCAFAEAADERERLSELYVIQRAAVMRFSMLCKAHEAVWLADDPDDAFDRLCEVFYRKGQTDTANSAPDVRVLAQSMDRWFHDGEDGETEVAVRAAWQSLESKFREMGRRL